MSKDLNAQKKSNPKIVVIALAVICIVLGASLVGVIAVYKPNDPEMQAQLAEKEDTITSLQTQLAALQEQLSRTVNVSTYVTQIAYLNQQLAALNDTLTEAYSNLYDLEAVLRLEASGVLYSGTVNQTANTNATVWNDYLDYAGYVLVEATALSSTTYAQVKYTYSDYTIDLNQTLGTTGTAIFPILPATVEVKIGNLDTVENSANATVTYFY